MRMYCERNIEDIQKDYSGYREGVFIGHCMKCGTIYLVVDGLVVSEVVFVKLTEETALQTLTIDLIKGLRGVERSIAKDKYDKWRDEQRKLERKEARRDISRIYQRKRRAVLAAKNLCIECGEEKELGRELKRFCLTCSKKKTKIVARRAQRYAQQGRCPRCGRQREDKVFILCKACRDYGKEKQRRRRGK